ncbi:hypothetical protein [Aestuariicoccus sp. MJ-SS9]|uniref:hypothetical protein n=1 Tax=Aestuariicoccus sp. MJ-SS9 TaxID=3079855 RepID=UPI00291483C2|nr:hypothetical protein [Aestuariicoccus sp. MJ-SS9]MDU8912170.1 hypothetical protein [Aestuariicoccus sp. MJ-SS9]
MKRISLLLGRRTVLGAALVCSAGLAQADQVFLDDVIVDGSLCVGFDCVNGESFGFDTLRLKENNLRIKAQDTSSSASFPTNDWRITFNETSNGGLNKFSIDDIDGGRTPFTLEAGAPSHSLYVDDGGRVGFGTSTPVVDLHVKSGNTPTLRLEQDGSSGFTAQTWDLAGNEANFFLRDATNGSALVFRAKPGAPTNAISIDSDGDVGMGLQTAAAPLHIKRSSGGFLGMIELENNGAMALIMDNNDASNPVEWRMGQIPGNTDLVLVSPDGPGDEFKLSTSGNLTITGNFISGTTTLNVPDYVFAADYDLRPLSEVRAFIDANSHLPDVPSAAQVAETGLNMSEMQMTLLRKIEELTLYTLEQEERIGSLTSELERLAN